MCSRIKLKRGNKKRDNKKGVIKKGVTLFLFKNVYSPVLL